MESTKLQNKIIQTLHEFESLENIEPTSDWNQTLMEKIASKQSNTTGLKYKVLVLLLVFINITFLLIFSRNKSVSKPSQQNIDLRTIANELLISPNSLNE
jgi:hypothetical protein